MAIGDDSKAEGFGFVPDTGSDEALVKWGAREINRTRDFLAQVKRMIDAVWPVSKGGTGATDKLNAKKNLGITTATSVGQVPPTGGDQQEGDIFFKIV